MAESARTTVYLDPQVFRALKVKAAASDRSLSEIVNEAALRALREDAADLAAFDDRARQPSRPFEHVRIGSDKGVDAVKFAAESIERDLRRKRTVATIKKILRAPGERA